MSEMPWEDFRPSSNTTASGPWDDFKAPSTAPEGSSQLDVAKFAMDQTASLAPWNKVNQAYKNAVGYGVEKAGQYTNLDPNTIAAVATPIAIAPEILSAYTGLKGIYNSLSPTVQGLVNTPEELSPQYSAQNTAVGISNDAPELGAKTQYPNTQQYPSQLENIRYKQNKPILGMNVEPTPVSTGTKMPMSKPTIAAEPLPSTTPIKYSDDPATLINQINDRIGTHGTNLNPQELQDYKEILSTKMHPLTGEIPPGTPLYAKATQAQQKVTSTLNSIVDPLLENKPLPPGTIQTRTGINQAYGISAKQQAIQNFIKKYAVRGAETGLGALGAKQLYDYFRK